MNLDRIIHWLHHQVGLRPEQQYKLFITLVVISTILVLRAIVLRLVFKKFEDEKVRYVWRKTCSYIAFTIIFLAVGRIWFTGFHSFSTFLGLLSAGLAIALQVPIVNLAGWAFLLWRRPFDVGDRIEIGKLRGDVIDQRIFMFTILEVGNWVDADQSTGRIIHVPNGKVFQEYIANYSKGFYYIWHEIPVLITFESNWRKAKKCASSSKTVGHFEVV